MAERQREEAKFSAFSNEIFEMSVNIFDMFLTSTIYFLLPAGGVQPKKHNHIFITKGSPSSSTKIVLALKLSKTI